MKIDLLITSKQYNLESWNLDSTLELMKASYVLVIVNWNTKIRKKQGDFCLENLLIRL